MDAIPLEVVIGVAVFVAVIAVTFLRRVFPALRSVGSPVEVAAVRRATRAEAELEDANMTIAQLTAMNEKLEKERSLTSVIELVQKVSLGVDQTLEKLAALNGGLQASAHAHEVAAQTLEETNRTMQASTKAIEFVATQILNREP